MFNKMHSISKIVVICVLAGFVVPGYADITPLPNQAVSVNSVASVAEAYRMYKDVNPTIKVPTAVEVPFNAEFLLPDVGEGHLTLNVSGATLLTASGLTLLLDNYVALPKYIEIYALTPAGTKVILAKTQMNSQTVRFPKTTAQNWIISLTFGQPLRTTELKFIEENAGVVQNR